MRPVPARWFELLTSRDDLGGVLECLGRSGMVQLETYSDVEQPETLATINAALNEHAELAERYAPFWPAPAPSDGESHTTDLRVVERVIENIREWVEQAEPLIVERQGLTREFESLALIREWLDAASGGALPDLEALGGAGPVMATRLFALSAGTWPTAVSPSVLLHKTETEGHNFVLAAGRARQIEMLDETMRGLKARCLNLPDWLPAGHADALRAIDDRRRTIEDDRSSIDERLEELAERHGLPALLSHMRFLRWMASEVPQMATTEHFAWVTGWTSDRDGDALNSRLDDSGLDYLIRYPPAPERAVSPMLLHNPGWARAFEVFGGLMGTPAAQNVDPSTLVALVAPLMFGYMFGDVGHGAVLFVAGLYLRRSYPTLALLIPGGLVSMVFGVLFGSVFANESLIPALWLHPLEQPLPLLIVALVFGICVITLGIVLDAVQAVWSKQGWAWLQTRAGILVAYLSLLGALLQPALLWLAAIGFAWFVTGESSRVSGHLLARAGAAIAEAVETLLQLLVNTVSFIRVGAFALAHAGLSVAVMGIAEVFSSVPAKLLVYVIGNLFIIVLEGLVVGIQATRLVLFEFFIRFLRVEGRAFRPLSAPENSNGERT